MRCLIEIATLLILLGNSHGVDYTDYYILSENKGPSPAILTSFSPNVSVSVGERAMLSCRVAHTTMNTVSWVRHTPSGAPRLLAVGKFVFVPDSRMEVAEVTSTGDWILVIKRSLIEDSGWYECQVNTNPHTSHTIFLSVQEPHSYIKGKKEVYIDSGSTRTIMCVVESPTPPHHIFWYFNGQPFDPGLEVRVKSQLRAESSWSQLEIVRAQSHHSGQYECRPSNSEPSSVYLTVLAGKQPAELHQTNTKPSSAISIHQVKPIIGLNLWLALAIAVVHGSLRHA